MERLRDRQQSRLAGQIEAPDEATAIEKAAAEFKVPATKLMAVRQLTRRKGELGARLVR